MSSTTANGVGSLLASWVGPTATPANLTHEHHHHHGEALGPDHLTTRDLIHDVPLKSGNSMAALAESWVAPADPVNTTHAGGLHKSFHENPMEVGADPTPENSVFGLVNSWVNGDSKPANLGHDHHHHDVPHNLSSADLPHGVAERTGNSMVALAESWLAPADPVNTTHEGGLHRPMNENPMQIGADPTPANSVLGMVSTWVSSDAKEKPANMEHNHNAHHNEALGPERLASSDLRAAYK